MAKEYRISAERLEELQQELTYLKTVREKEVAEQIKEARSFGDLSENSEYDEAKNEQGKLYSRMAELEEILSNYTIIDDSEKSADMIHVGTTVVVKTVAAEEIDAKAEDLVTEPVQENENSKAVKTVLERRALSIAFLDAEGNEIRAALPVSVTVGGVEVAEADTVDVVRLDDKKEASLVAPTKNRGAEEGFELETEGAVTFVFVASETNRISDFQVT